MPPTPSKQTKKEENKIEVICHFDQLMDDCDALDAANSKSITADYADDEPRKLAIRGLDNLHRGLYGKLTDRQDAELTYVLQQISKQEELDRANDILKQEERTIIARIKTTARSLRNDYRKK